MTHRPLALWLLATLPAVASAAAPGFLEDDVEVLWTSTGVSGTLYGWVTAPVPDLDGDGAPEVLLSAPAAVHGDGRVVLLSGRTGEQLFDFLGTGSEALGEALADAGDVDGDGLHDVILGAPGAGAGAAYVFSGADGSLLLSLAGARTGDRFGATVAGLGDMDGDGRSDIAVGAPLAGEIGAGVVTVYVGATGDVIFSLEGEAAGDDFGDGVDEVGDLDLDGVPDLVVGAPDAGASDGGAIYVYAGATGERLLGPLEAGRTSWDFGKWFVDGPGDLDGDGVPDVYASDFSGARQAGLVTARSS